LTLSQILTFCQRYLGSDVDREADLIPVLDGEVRRLLKTTGAQRIYFDPSTGKHPGLATTSGTLIYDYPSWALKILMVYNSSTADEDRSFYPRYPVTANDFSREIIFAEDPGTSTTTYKLIGTIKFAGITSENESLLVIPEDWRFPLLVAAIISSFKPNDRKFGVEKYEDYVEDFNDLVRAGAKPIGSGSVAAREEWGYWDGEALSDYRKSS